MKRTTTNLDTDGMAGVVLGSLVESNGESIEVASVLGQGASFTVLLPAVGARPPGAL